MSEYPCQGDTWRKDDVDFITVTGVDPTGVIHYMKGISYGDYRTSQATLEPFLNYLEQHGLGVPHYCTDRYHRLHGAFN